MPQVKMCTMCGEEKPADLSHFYAHKGCRGGIDSACRACRNRQRTEWKRRNLDRVKARRNQLYHERNGERMRAKARAREEARPLLVAAERLMEGIRSRCQERGYSRAQETRSKAFFEAWLRRQPNCECCGKPFRLGPKNGVKHDLSASIDRFDTSRGYDIDNIALICWRCNNIKRNYAPDDLEMVAAWIRRRAETNELNSPNDQDPRAE